MQREVASVQETEKIIKRIIVEAEKGISIDKSVMNFASDLGFETDIKGIERILLDKDHEIHGELRQLVFSPDFESRKRFSLIWQDILLNGSVFTIESLVKKTGGLLLKGIDGSEIYWEEDLMLTYFFEKLGFFRDIDKSLFELYSLHDEDTRIFVTATIWFCCNDLNSQRTEKLELYLRKASIPGTLSMNEFSFFVNILLAWDYEKSEFDKYITRLNHIYQKAYKNSVETDSFLKTNNIETFMVQGGRVLAADPAKLSAQKHYLWGIAQKLCPSGVIFSEDGVDMIF